MQARTSIQLFLRLSVLALPLLWQSNLTAAPMGIAAMGASETQGTTYDGSWVPYLANLRGLNFGPGQTYNRARGGNTTSDLLANGQHTQVATLVDQGKVDLAFLTIGGLDIPPVITKILTVTLNTPAFVAQVNGNIATAMDAVLDAGDVRMIVLSLPDMTLTGGGQALLTEPELRQPVIDVVDQVNAVLKAQVLARDQVYVDFAGLMREWNASPLIIGGVTINTVETGTTAEHLWLDGLHVATVGNNLFANLMLSAINKTYGTNYALFSDLNILQRAGLQAGYTGETSNIDFAKFVYLPNAVPEPSSLALLSLGIVSLLWTQRPRVRRVA